MKTLLLLSLLLASPSIAAPRTKLIIDNLNKPVGLAAPVNSTDYFYILEQAGTIKVYDRKKNQLLKKPFLDIRNRIKIRMSEQGLLGIAFCPNFKKTGRFYLNYTNRKGDTEIVRFHCDPNSPLSANPDSSETLLSVKQDYRNHNGGWLGFGPDKMLYIGFGDGGASNDPNNRAQSLDSYLGKLLRINVNQKNGYSIPQDNPFLKKHNAKPEIYAYGLRNPWRCSWDNKTNDFYIADVGQNKREEINFKPAGKGASANYGWRLREADIRTPDRTNRKAGGDKPANSTEPVFSYSHGIRTNQGLSITGGFVYRGTISELQGRYFFADYVNPRIWSITMKNGSATQFKDWTSAFLYDSKPIKAISSFAQDPQGELYIISHFGKVFKIVE